MTADRTKVTIYDVAARAGVAISTVSRVINNSNDVSEGTRDKVKAAIEALQFRPDRTARTLAQKNTLSVAVALPTFTTPFHNELLKGVRSVLREEDIDFLLCDLGSRKRHQTLLNFLQRGTVDGLLLVGVRLDQEITAELKALQAPVVILGTEANDFDCFSWDNRYGAQAAVSHLIELGHSRIGMIRSDSDSDLQIDRIAGYKQAMESAGIPTDNQYIVSGHTEKHGGYNEESGFEAMNDLLKQSPRITALFASSDVQAIGAWKAIYDAGLKVPQDIAVVGYDDIKTSHYLGLTSVDQQMQDIGEEATQLLLGRIQGSITDAPRKKLITPTLRIRRSSVPRA